MSNPNNLFYNKHFITVSLFVVILIIYGGYKLHGRDKETREYFKKVNKVHASKLKFINKPWNLCTNNNGSDLDAFVYVYTHASSFDQREMIRQTWGNRKFFPTINVAFVLGLVPHKNINIMIDHENKQKGDIIQADFIDSFRNLTFKSLSAWSWMKDNCMNVKHVLKLDDSIVLNTNSFLDYIHLEFRSIKNSFACNIQKDVEVERYFDAKYYVSYKDYSEYNFKKHCNGSFILYSFDLVPRLFEATFVTKHLPLDNVYISVLSEKIANIEYIELGNKITVIKYIPNENTVIENHLFVSVEKILYETVCKFFIDYYHPEFGIYPYKTRNRFHPLRISLKLKPSFDPDDVKDLDLFVFVYSQVGNYEKREAIRETWGSRTFLGYASFHLVFVLASSIDTNVNLVIKAENEKNNDIIQGDFEEDYRLEFLKSMLVWRVMKDSGVKTRFFLKVDESVYVNTRTILSYLGAKPAYYDPPKHSFSCVMHQSVRVNRDKGSAIYVKLEEYDKEEYPTYCDGQAVLMTHDLVFDLFNMSMRSKDFWIDDVYVGMVASRLDHLKYYDASEFYYSGQNFKNEQPAKLRSFFYILNMKNYDDFEQVWKLLT